MCNIFGGTKDYREMGEFDNFPLNIDFPLDLKLAVNRWIGRSNLNGEKCTKSPQLPTRWNQCVKILKSSYSEYSLYFFIFQNRSTKHSVLTFQRDEIKQTQCNGITLSEITFLREKFSKKNKIYGEKWNVSVFIIFI